MRARLGLRLNRQNGRMDWLIYGANGYTGELIARSAAEIGMAPALAGRTREKVEPLATELGLPSQVFGLDDPDAIAANIAGAKVVLNCAGPFSATSAPILEACLQAGVHYLDITGEIAVFEHAHAQAARAEQAGIVVCPGVGFDVIPTDSVAAALKAALPDATRLALGFDTRGAMSPGTAATSIEALATGGCVRRGGRLVAVPLGAITRRIDFGDGEKFAVAIPWGDVSTAYRTTGIGDIEVYVPTSPRRARQLRLANLARPLVKHHFVQQFLKSRVASTVTGPDANARAKSPTYVWGEVSNDRGERRVARIKTANGYDLTVAGALAAVRHLLDHTPPGGSYTPSQLLGADLVTTLPGSGRLILE